MRAHSRLQARINGRLIYVRPADAVLNAFGAPLPCADSRGHKMVGSSCKLSNLYWSTGNNQRSTRGLLPGIEYEVRWHQDTTRARMPSRSETSRVTGASAPRLALSLSSGAILFNEWHIRRFTPVCLAGEE